MTRISPGAPGRWRIIPAFPAYEINRKGEVWRRTRSRTRRGGYLLRGQTLNGKRCFTLVAIDGKKAIRRAEALINQAFFAAPDDRYDSRDGDLKWCPRCKYRKPLSEFGGHRLSRRGVYCKECAREYGRLKWRREPAAERLLKTARFNAKKLGIPFDLSLADIVIPERCPVLGIEIKTDFLDKRASPSVDRIRPELGYVRGNVVIVSWRANSLKGDATIEELTKISRFYSSLTQEERDA